MRAALQTVAAVVTRIEELALAWGILAIAALTIGNVFGRTLFGESLAFAEELSRFAIVLVTFLGIGYGASQARHIRMSAVHDQLPTRGRKVLMTIVTGTTSALMFFLTALSVDYVLGTVAPLGAVSPVLRVPVWIVYLAAPVGLLLGGIQYALAFATNLIRPEVYLSAELREDDVSDEDAVEL